MRAVFRRWAPSPSTLAVWEVGANRKQRPSLWSQTGVRGISSLCDDDRPGRPVPALHGWRHGTPEFERRFLWRKPVGAYRAQQSVMPRIGVIGPSTDRKSVV